MGKKITAFMVIKMVRVTVYWYTTHQMSAHDCMVHITRLVNLVGKTTNEPC